MAIVPATGSEVVLGRIYKAYTNTTPTAGSAVKLSATLGAYMGQAAGTTISLSSRFGGQPTPYAY